MLLFVGITSVWAADYELYSESSISAGDYIIVGKQNSSGKYYALNNTCTNDQYMGITEVTISDNKISTTSADIVWSISASSNGYYIQNGSNYLDDNATSKKNYAQLVSSPTTTSEWTFEIKDGLWTITNYGTETTKKTLAFNVGSTRVATYTAVQSGHTQIYLYKLASTDPSVSYDEDGVDFGNVALGASITPVEFDITGENLTSALTVESSNEDVFTVAVKAGSSLTPDGDGNVSATLVITPITTAYGAFDEGIIISDGGLETDSLVPVSMHVGGIVTVTPASPDLAFGNVPQNATAADYAKTITVSATHLTANKQIRIICPSNFQSDPIDIYADANGVIEATEVKLMPITDREAGSYGSADAKYSVTCTGTAEFASIEIGAPTMTIIACTTLDKPSNVTVSNKVYPYDAVALAWDEVENADSYEVYIYQGETLIDADEVNTEAYTIGETLAAATTYSYQIIAKSEDAAYCESAVTSDDFTTEDLPAAVLTLSENGVTREWGSDLKITSVIALPTAVDAGNEVAGKVLVGWSADADRATAPELAKGANYTMNATAVTLYAVYATETPGTPSLTKQSSGATFSAGDNIVIVAISGDDEYALYQETKGTSYVKNWAFDNTTATVATDAKKYVTLIAVPDETTFYLGDATNGYLYNSSSNNLAISTTDSTKWAIAWNNTNSAFTIIGNGRWLSCRTDAANDNANMYRMGGATSGSENGICYLDIYKYDAGTPSYSDYTTSGAKAPSATVNPEEVEISAAALVGGLIDVTYENVNQANVTVALFNDAECTEEFDGGWLTASLDANKDIVYGAEAAVSYANVRTAYIKLTAPSTDNTVDPAIVVIPVTQAYKDRVFASFEELVASDLPRDDKTGTYVTVSFSNVKIHDISGKSVYLNIKDKVSTEQYIQIYNTTGNAPAGWTVNGYLTASSDISGYWQLYSGAMELKISIEDWAGITYESTPTALDNTEVDAKAVKVLRNGILLIEKNGHTYNAMGQLVK